jgi:uncharacterized repeat protein (TIGR01451 family)
MRVMKVMLVAAMAVGGCVDATSEDSADLSSCVSAQGFWKNHDPWPVAGLRLGTVSYTEAQLKSVLRESVGGNGIVDLAHQLIAAKLNVASGASSPAFAAAIASADAMVGSRVVPPVGSGSLPLSMTTALSAQLDAYNSGRLNAGPCVGPQADVAITETVDNAMPNLGDTITFTVTISDNGPVDASGVVVDDVLPAGLAFASATASQGSYDPASGMWQVGNVTTAAPQTLALRAVVTSSSTLTNTATIAHADQFDPNLGNNAASVVVAPEGADLGLTQTVDNHTPNVGDTISFMIILNDNGPSAATNVTVGDVLPPGLAFVAAQPSQGSYNATTGAWTVGTVTTAAIQTLRIDARVVAASTEVNTAAITHADQADPDPGNNVFTVTVSPTGADLAITNAVNNASPNVGDTISFMVILSDLGPSPATNVTVSDLLPTGLAFVSAQPSQGSYNATTGVWTVGTVTTGVIQTLRIDATVASTNTLVDSVAITHADELDPDPGNNVFTVTVSPATADLAITNTVNNASPNVGDTISFMVILSDNGPGTANNVTVSDLLPAGLAFVSAQPSQGSYNTATGAWTVGTVTTGVIQTLRIDATVVGASTLVDTAAIAHADQFDPNTGNNAFAVTISPVTPAADLSIAQTVSNGQPNVGDTVVFTISLANHGPNAGTNVSVTDLLPAGLALVSASSGQGTYNGVTGLWTVGTVTTTSPLTLALVARVTSPAAMTNTAAISHADQVDPVVVDNAASVTITPQQADLEIAATVSNRTPNVGDTVVITLAVTNDGPSAATNVTASVPLPPQLSFVSATSAQGTYNVVSGVWSVGSVANGATQSLTIVATVNSADPASSTASITHADQFDSQVGNNAVPIRLNALIADLSISQTVDNPTPNVGDMVTFNVTIANNGPAGATNVVVADLLPPGLTFVSALTTQGGYINATGQWFVGSVSSAQTLTLAGRVTSAFPMANTASVTGSDQDDPVAGNNAASATVTPQQADIAISATLSNSSPALGDVVTYRAVIVNSGPNAATNVTANGLPSSPLSPLSATVSQGSYDLTTGQWLAGTVGGTPAVLEIQARVVSTNESIFVMSVSADQFDPTPADHAASVHITPQ